MYCKGNSRKRLHIFYFKKKYDFLRGNIPQPYFISNGCDYDDLDAMKDGHNIFVVEIIKDTYLLQLTSTSLRSNKIDWWMNEWMND